MNPGARGTIRGAALDSESVIKRGRHGLIKKRMYDRKRIIDQCRILSLQDPMLKSAKKLIDTHADADDDAP